MFKKIKKIIETIEKKEEERHRKALEAREQDIRQRMEVDEEFRKRIEEQQKEEAEWIDSFARKPRAVEFQKNIMENLICPLCNNNKFLDASFQKHKSSTDYRYTIESLKICRRCGFMIRYYDFNKDDFDTNNFDADDNAVYLNDVRHS